MSILRVLLLVVAFVSLISAIAVPSSLPVSRKRETTPKDPICAEGGPGWAPYQSVGGIGDNPPDPTVIHWCETQFGHDYTPVSAIEVWRKGDDYGSRISGLQFTYGSGHRSDTYGTQDTSRFPSETLILQPGELITSAILYGDGRSAYLGHIHIETNLHQSFDAGKDPRGITPWAINVGSGLLLGADVYTHNDDQSPGHGEGDIAALGLLFLGTPIERITIKDISFENNPLGSNSGISPENILIGQWFNKQKEAEASYNLAPTYGVGISHSYSQSVTNSFGISTKYEVSGQLFSIGVKRDIGFAWNRAQNSATNIATTSSTAVVCAASGVLKPGKAVKATGYYQTGKGIFDYTSKVIVHLVDGRNYTYSEKGTLENVAYNQCSTIIEDADPDDVPVNSNDLISITDAPSPTMAPILPRQPSLALPAGKAMVQTSSSLSSATLSSVGMTAPAYTGDSGDGQAK